METELKVSRPATVLLKEATTPRRLLATSVTLQNAYASKVAAGRARCGVRLTRGGRAGVDRGQVDRGRRPQLGISDTTLGNWVRAQRDAAERAGDPEALTGGKRAELRRLRKENADLRMDREILRTAAAYFARETMQ